MQEIPHPSKLPPQATRPDRTEHPSPIETPRQHTPLEEAIIQATPDAEKAPSWFKTTVHTIANAWFDPKSFESVELYERLGVKAVRDFYRDAEPVIHHMVYKKFGMEKWAQHKNSQPLKNMELFTRLYEATHLASFAALTSFTVEAFAQGKILPAVTYAALNTYFNVCPIMLQRYNRIRLYHAIHRMEARSTPGTLHASRTIPTP